MRIFDRLEHPVLHVTINGSLVDKRPLTFELITDKGFPSVVSRLRFAADSGTGREGDKVTVNLSYDDYEALLFTGTIYDAAIHGAFRDLALTDSYKKLCDTTIAAAYRKEMANIILRDTLEAAGINDTAVTCPEVELARFSTRKITADEIIVKLIKALQEHGYTGLRFFFDEKDVFHFGTSRDTGKNEGEAFAFETGKTIFKKSAGKIEVLPLPIRHTRDITVDDTPVITSRTALYLSGSRSRLALWLEAP